MTLQSVTPAPERAGWEPGQKRQRGQAPLDVLPPAFDLRLPWAFAAQALACQRELGIHNAKLNVNGGAIAIAHPLGCSGARLATTLIHQMARTGASRGIASLCIRVGQGLATVFERE